MFSFLACTGHNTRTDSPHAQGIRYVLKVCDRPDREIRNEVTLIRNSNLPVRFTGYVFIAGMPNAGTPRRKHSVLLDQERRCGDNELRSWGAVDFAIETSLVDLPGHRTRP